MPAKRNSNRTALKRVPFVYKRIHKSFAKKTVSQKLRFADARHVLASEFRIGKHEYFSVLKIKKWWYYGYI